MLPWFVCTFLSSLAFENEPLSFFVLDKNGLVFEATVDLEREKNSALRLDCAWLFLQAVH